MAVNQPGAFGPFTLFLDKNRQRCVRAGAVGPILRAMPTVPHLSKLHRALVAPNMPPSRA
ncbi:MAG: hypothetical protein L0215_00010 [Gemmataceae bacterium]|nr:hypothetical protein [Gemmataceae bacterium]